MASLIDEKRRRRCEIMKIRKKRFDTLNAVGFFLSAISIVFCFVTTLLAIGGFEMTMYAVPFLILATVLQILGCIKRNYLLNVAALVFAVIAGIIYRECLSPVLLITVCISIVANVAEHQLSKEDGYPQFDLTLEDRMRQQALEEQIRRAAAKQLPAGTDAQDMPQVPPAKEPSDMEYI